MSKHYFIQTNGDAAEQLFVSADGEQPIPVSADLAAAAPDLLEACKSVLEQYRWIKNEGPYKGAKDIIGGAIARCKGAIAKAEGGAR